MIMKHDADAFLWPDRRITMMIFPWNCINYEGFTFKIAIMQIMIISDDCRICHLSLLSYLIYFMRKHYGIHLNRVEWSSMLEDEREENKNRV